MGMVTHESILRGLSNFGLSIEQLRVGDVIVKAPDYRPEDDLFDLLDRLRDTNAVLILDGEQKLIGIVTSYDSTEYFRRRAEDMMLVEDIETMLKDLLLSAHMDADGKPDQEALRTLIENITSSFQDIKRKYGKALTKYLKQTGQFESDLEKNAFEDSFTNLIPKQEPKEFDQLSLAEYIALLLHPKHWDIYAPMLNISPEAIQKLLDGVRETRNGLAHFRHEITSAQRDQLNFCVDWLDQNRAIPVSWPTYIVQNSKVQISEKVVRESAAKNTASPQKSHDIVPTEEMISPQDSRYTPLNIWLRSQPDNNDRVRLTLEEIESIINSGLPASARKHRVWWANNPARQPHSQQWLEAGWRSTYVNLTEEHVTFARIVEREKAYIQFFGDLLVSLRENAPFKVKEVSPDGHNWVVVYGLPEGGPQHAVLTYAFTHRKRFRVELYIDTGDKETNKSIFDKFHAQKSTIETAIGETISWERINNKRACRIAQYTEGAIDDDPSELTNLKYWAVEAMIRFYSAIIEPATCFFS